MFPWVRLIIFKCIFIHELYSSQLGPPLPGIVPLPGFMGPIGIPGPLYPPFL